MRNDNKQFEKNVTASFAYVKKDILMLNDSFSELFERISHLVSNQARLTEEIASLKQTIDKSSKTKKVTKKKTKKK